MFLFSQYFHFLANIGTQFLLQSVCVCVRVSVCVCVCVVHLIFFFF